MMILHLYDKYSLNTLIKINIKIIWINIICAGVYKYFSNLYFLYFHNLLYQQVLKKNLNFFQLANQSTIKFLNVKWHFQLRTNMKNGRKHIFYKSLNKKNSFIKST